MTLRVYLLLALAADVAYADAYRAIAWLCWVPNILVAEWIVHRTRAPVAVATV